MAAKIRTRGFTATDQAGQGQMLYAETTYADTSDTRGPGEMAVSVTITTSSGTPLNRIGQGEYQNSYTGDIFRSDDPDAP